MIEKITHYVEVLNSYVWGWAMLALLLGVGLYFTIRTTFVQVRKFRSGAARLLGFHKYKTLPEGGDVSSFGALMTSLSSTIGTGNITGVAMAITLGGPGALFWMWITAFLGMATKYAEACLAVHYREKDKDGRTVGGPMYYIKNGLGRRWVWLATLFSSVAIFTALTTGSSIQANGVADVLQSNFQINPAITGLILAVVAAAVILGGIKWIASVASVLVPFMAIGYVGGGLFIMAVHADQVVPMFAHIFHSAFNMKAASGGAVGGLMWFALRKGVARGLFSNEAGQGSSPIAHAAAQVDHPVDQGLMAMFGVFIDTLVVCSITGFVILLSNVVPAHCSTLEALKLFQAGGTIAGCDTGAPLTATAFGINFPGGETFVALALTLFAFTTILGWSYYGERCAEFLFGEKIVVPFRVVWIVWTFLGAAVLLAKNEGFYGVVNVAWNFSDVMTALMAAPNLIALALLSPVVLKLTRDFFSGRWEMADPNEVSVPKPEY